MQGINNNTLECASQVKRLNPYRGKNRQRPCLTNDGGAKEYESDEFCKNRNCSDIPEFQYSQAFGGYFLMLNTGNFGIRKEDMRCRILRLRQYEWLDYRTRSLKLLFFTFNANGDPRIGRVMREYTFDFGGKVSVATTAAALPVFEINRAGFGLSVFLTVYTFVFSLSEFGILSWLRGCYYRKANNNNTKIQFSLELSTIVKKKIKYCDFLEKLFIFTFIFFMLGFYFALVVRVTQYNADGVDEALERPIEYVNIQQQSLVSLFYQWEVLFYFIFAAVLLVLSRCISLLNFHPSAAKIGGTFDLAKQDLASFLLVYLMVVVTYSIVGLLLIGRTREYYGLFPQMFNSLLLVSVGEVEDMYNALFINSPAPYIQQILEGIYFWSFIIISTILMFNILLAIIVDAFITLNQRVKSGEGFLSLWRCFSMFLEIQWLSLVVFLKNFKRKLRNGCCCLKCKKQNSEEEADLEKEETDNSFVYPLNELIMIFYQRRGRKYTTMQIREYLHHILHHNSSSIELMIVRMRYLSEIEKLQVKSRSLRGLDVGSEELQGYQLFLLEKLFEAKYNRKKSKLKTESDNMGGGESHLIDEKLVKL